MATCKDMNAPVLAESKKVNATLSELYDISGSYSFSLDEEFAEMVQMNAREHGCVCGRAHPDEHHCCSGDYRPVDSELEEKVKILGGYDFDVQEPFTVAKQMINLLLLNLPLSIYTYGKSQESYIKQVGVPTIFFADAASAHRFAGHVTHACTEYYYHEEYLHALYHDDLLDWDLFPVKALHHALGERQRADNNLHEAVMAGYLGGGVGAAVVRPTEGWIEQALGEDVDVAAGKAWFGIHVFGDESAAEKNVFLLARVGYVACEPIEGEVAPWSVEWIGDDGLLFGGEEGARGVGGRGV